MTDKKYFTAVVEFLQPQKGVLHIEVGENEEANVEEMKYDLVRNFLEAGAVDPQIVDWKVGLFLMQPDGEGNPTLQEVPPEMRDLLMKEDVEGEENEEEGEEPELPFSTKKTIH